VVFIRLLSGTIILAAFATPVRRQWTAHQVKLVASLGALLASLNLTFYEAIARAPLGVVVTIEFVGPLAVAVFGSRRRADLLWAALAAGGIALLTNGTGRSVSLIGLILALAAGALWACYILVGERIGRELPGTTALVPAMALAAALLLPWGVLSARSHLADPGLMLAGAAVGLLSSAIPWSLELEALRRVPAHIFSVVVSLSPAVAAIMGLLLLGERLPSRAWVAIVLVVFASAAASRSQSAEIPRDL
jgi:inner membrane transporter RhtA